MSILGSAACAGGSGGCSFGFGVPAPAPAGSAPAERKYLLERVDDAAVVQLYADGFKELSLKERTLVWHLYQAALAGRDIFYDQKYTHNLEMRDVLEAIVRKPQAGIEPATFAEILRHTKLFWINTGPFNNLCRSGSRGGKGRRAVSAEERRDPRPAGDTAAADVLRSECRSDGDKQDSAGGQGHPGVERQQPVRRRDDEGSRRVQGSPPSQLSRGEGQRQARRGGLSSRWPLRQPDRRYHPAPRSRHPVCHRPHGQGARGPGDVLQDRRDRRP